MILLLLLFGGCIEDCKKQKDREDREECIKNCLKALNTKKIIEEIEKMNLDKLEEQLSILKDLQKIIKEIEQEIEQEIEVKKEEFEIGR